MILNMFSQMFPQEKENEHPTPNLTELLVKTRDEIAMTEDMFNLTDDEDLMECTVYKLKSLQIYYQYLLKQIRCETTVVPIARLQEKEVVSS